MRVLIALLGLLMFKSLIAEQILVVTDEWEGYTSKEGKGYYIELLQKIYSDPDDHLNVVIVPYARSIGMVAAGKADIVLGIYRGEMADKHLASHVVEQDLVDILVSDSIYQSWKGIETLEGLVVLAKIGYAFDDVTGVKMKYAEKSSLEGMVKMLSVGRADGILDYKADLLPFVKNEGLDKKGYHIIESVLSSPIYFGFADTAKAAKLKARFEKGFEALYHSGEVKRLMDKNLGSSKGLTENLESWN